MAIINRVRFAPLTADEAAAASWVEVLLARFFVREEIPTRSRADVLYLRRFHLFSEKVAQYSEAPFSAAAKWFYGPCPKRWVRLWFFLHALAFKTWTMRLYLHCFYRSDEDPDPHDHPWDFWSLVLWRGYWDETWNVVRDWVGKPWRMVLKRPRRGFLAFARRRAEHLHRAQLLDETKRTWTLIGSGMRRRDWYFYTEDGPVHWQEYLRARGQDVTP